MSKGSYYRPGMSDAQREAYNKYKRDQNKALREKFGYRQHTYPAIDTTQPTAELISKEQAYEITVREIHETIDKFKGGK